MWDLTLYYNKFIYERLVYRGRQNLKNYGSVQCTDIGIT